MFLDTPREGVVCTSYVEDELCAPTIEATSIAGFILLHDKTCSFGEWILLVKSPDGALSYNNCTYSVRGRGPKKYLTQVLLPILNLTEG